MWGGLEEQDVVRATGGLLKITRCLFFFKGLVQFAEQIDQNNCC